MADITSPFAAALTLLWAPTGLIIAAYLGLLQFKVWRQMATNEHCLRSCSAVSELRRMLITRAAARRRSMHCSRRSQHAEEAACSGGKCSLVSIPSCHLMLGACLAAKHCPCLNIPHSHLLDVRLCSQPWPDSALALKTLSGANLPASSSSV